MQENKKDAYKELVKIVDRLFDIKLKKELADIVSKLVKEELSKHIDLTQLANKSKIKNSTDALIDNIVSSYENGDGKQYNANAETEKAQIRNMYESAMAETQQMMQQPPPPQYGMEQYQHQEAPMYAGIDVEPPVQVFNDPRLAKIMARGAAVHKQVSKKK